MSKPCDCSEQDPRFTVPMIWHKCWKPKPVGLALTDWEANDLRFEAERGVTGRIPMSTRKPVYDALEEEIDRSPITRYMRGGASVEDPPFLFDEERCRE